jgi:DNA-binding MarR family transcriptional regulator
MLFDEGIFKALIMLRYVKRASTNDIAEKTGLSRTHVRRIIDDLEDMKLVDTNKRNGTMKKIAWLTDRGNTVAGHVAKAETELYR